jgi:type II restriction/modification system DNA methylase subunit YeeA
MNKTAIKNFAIWARNKLIADIQYRAGLIGITADGIKDPLPQSTGTMEFYDIGTSEPYAITGDAIPQRKKLVEVIRRKEKDSSYATAYKYILEEVAYTWFNRLIAIRFMEVNDYLPSHIRVLSSESGKIEPDLVTTPFDAELSLTTEEEQTILRLKNENKLDELFRLLFIKQCNALRSILPKLFERPEDYTELLLNLSVVDKEGVIYHLVHDIDENDFNIEKNGQVEIIGWLYQYYISERHDQIINIYKGTVKTEDVPAATQLFTTDWVVQYMVDNSLGKYWIERNPQSSLRVNLKYLAVPKDGTIPHIDEKVEPQSLTFFDPCMGSGHILIYAFDVLMDIYEECGYSTRDAASEIIRHNLFGLDIDPRAYQLAYFSLMMKARQYDRRFFTREIEPQIYCPKSESDLVRFGSLVQVDTLEEKPQEPTDLTLFNMNYEDILNDWNFRRLLAQKYAAVCTNPPYLNKYNPQLKDYVIENYKDYSGDLFSVFIYRNLLLCQPDGYCGFMTPFVWMFIKTYEKLREFIINNKSITSLIQMEYSAFEEATVPICSFVLQNKKSNEPGLYFRLSDFKGGMEVQRKKVLEAIANPDCGYFYEAQQSNFSKIPGSPVAYWVSNGLLEAFDSGKSLDEIALARNGMKTGENGRFVRLWWEVAIADLNLYAKDWKSAVASKAKWFPYNKGGEYRKWYGNNDCIVNWENQGNEIFNHAKADKRNVQDYPLELKFIPSVSWSLVTSGQPAFRYKVYNLSDIAGMSFFTKEPSLSLLLGFCNSKIALEILRILAPTINFQAGDIGRLPVVEYGDQAEGICNLVSSNIALSKDDWDSYEPSWDFKRHPLLRSVLYLADAYTAWKSECEERFQQLKTNEEELNRIFIDIYGLQDELTPEVADKDVTVHRIFDTKDDVPESMQGSNYVRTKRDEIVSLLSYAVGCMFGRYSLDVDGLAYAGGDWDADKYKTFLPDRDGILPITDEEYLEDDIVSRLCDWLKAVYGADTLEENLDFIAGALGGKGNSSREIIRNYFLKDFFKDHCKTYQKRPIYWLFDSGKQNGFKALIYLHRYTPDTIGNLRVDYLHKMQRVYESEINRMQDMIDHSTNAREVAASTKRKEKLQKQLKECRDYDEMIAHLALSRIELDLDDGVKVNYEKIQTASDGKKYAVLAKI